jgi:Uncharacterized conserved protein
MKYDKNELIENSKKIMNDSNDKLTLRALFYKLVGINILENKKTDYQILSRVINNARWEHILNFDCIEDRIRTKIFPSFFDDVEDLIRVAVESYNIDIWKDQPNYIELLVEKDTLVSLFENIVYEYKINLSVTKGYNSLTEIYLLYKRLEEKKDLNKDVYILYVGDLDPSGLDMDRDIRARLKALGLLPFFERIALNIEDVKKYKLLPNRIKKKDPRSNNYKYNDCWEIDALDTSILKKKLVSKIELLIDHKKWNKSLEKQKNNKNDLERKLKYMK